MIHPNESKYAGKRIKLIEDFNHNQYPDMDSMIVEDWWDRVSGKSWMFAKGNPACMVYAMRIGVADYDVPRDNEVVYGKYNGTGVLVHVSEIDCVYEQQPNKGGK